MYNIYMLRCEDNSIYTGIATDVEHRMQEHFTKIKGAKYTKSHTPKRLEAVWQTKNRAQACKLEYHIKRLTKSQKEDLINKDNLGELLGEKVDCDEYKRIEKRCPFFRTSSMTN